MASPAFSPAIAGASARRAGKRPSRRIVPRASCCARRMKAPWITAPSPISSATPSISVEHRNLVECRVGGRAAAQLAFLVEIVAPPAMQSAAIVPHHEIAQRPFMDIDKTGLGRVLEQLAEKDARLRHRHAFDGARMRTDKQGFPRR